MKIGIIGTGNMGRSLGLLFSEQGHEVFFGARDLEKAKSAAVMATRSPVPPQSGTNREAAQFGEVLVYTLRGIAPADALGADAAGLLTGKIIIDMNNQEVPEDFIFPPIRHSLAEALSAQAPAAQVVKAFNTMGMEVFELCPEAIKPYRVAVFVAADDDAARTTVMKLAGELGFVPIDCGPLVHARLLEGAADLIRFLMIGREMLGANFSIPDLPAVSSPRLGGRQESATK